VHSDRTAHPSVIFRKESALSVGLYRQEDFPCEDLSLWLRLGTVGDLVSIPSDELIYTLRNSSVSGSRYFEANQKSTEILLALNTANNLINRAMDDFNDVLNFYKRVKLGRKRSLLFFRDLFHPIAFKILTIKQKRKVSLKFLTFLLNPLNLWKLLDIYLSQKKRRRYRSSD